MRTELCANRSLLLTQTLPSASALPPGLEREAPLARSLARSSCQLAAAPAILTPPSRPFPAWCRAGLLSLWSPAWSRWVVLPSVLKTPQPGITFTPLFTASGLGLPSAAPTPVPLLPRPKGWFDLARCQSTAILASVVISQPSFHAKGISSPWRFTSCLPLPFFCLSSIRVP